MGGLGRGAGIVKKGSKNDGRGIGGDFIKVVNRTERSFLWLPFRMLYIGELNGWKGRGFQDFHAFQSVPRRSIKEKEMSHLELTES